MSELINRSAIRKYVMDKWKVLRTGHEMTQVSKEFYVWADAHLRSNIDKMIQTHPSVGKTIRPDWL